MNNLVVNSIIKSTDNNGKELLERIIWLDNNDTAVTIDITSPNALPKIRIASVIMQEITQDNIKISDADPYGKYISESMISVRQKEYRDNSWKMIEKAALSEPEIYDGKIRGRLIEEIIKEYRISKNSAYKYLRRFWQRGKNINALLPDYINSGGRGKIRIPGGNKIGRPRKHIEIRGHGINVDDSIKKIFSLAVAKYYETPRKNTIPDAYRMMVQEYFSQGFRIEDGIRKPVVIDSALIPTMMQFRYWYNNNLDYKKSAINRFGAKAYSLSHRPILGTVDKDELGPGSLYNIDATIGDVYLVSSFDRNLIIGRPVIYAVIDVFSRMVAGIYVGLEGPSWVGSMMALANAATDKVSFCAEYGINIQNEQWPCKHVPQAIMGDRGEMESKNADTMIKSLHIQISNAPPYRGDLKGIVERYFLTLKGKRLKRT